MMVRKQRALAGFASGFFVECTIHMFIWNHYILAILDILLALILFWYAWRR